MAVSHERRALSFNGKPVLVYVSTSPSAGAMVLARCSGAGARAEDEGVTEDEYIAAIRGAVRELGYEATLQRNDDHQIVFDVRRL